MKKVKGSIQLIKMIPIKTQNQNSKKLDECYGIIDKMLDWLAIHRFLKLCYPSKPCLSFIFIKFEVK